MKYRHVILDRDGVLNVEADGGGYVRDPSEFQWIPGAIEALALLRRAGVHLSVATNQSGVGRGLMTLEQLEAVHDRMRTEASRGGGALDTVVFCPHAPDAGCTCRKPAPGMLLEALELSGIPAAASLVVGDAQRDLEAAARAGLQAALVRTGKGLETERLLGARRVPTYDDLSGLARAILSPAEHRVS
jgi:D-glycero-D-manno-heptose 1,7-bisphosphate phosphatase